MFIVLIFIVVKIVNNLNVGYFLRKIIIIVIENIYEEF